MRARVMLLDVCGRAELGFVAALERNNVAVDSTSDIDFLLQKLARAPANLVLLCIGDASSAPIAAMCSSVRRATVAPLMVIAQAATDDTAVRVLGEGADLVVVGRHEARYIAAQVEAVLRCIDGINDRASVPPAAAGDGKFISRDGRLAIDLAQRTVLVEGRAVPLTQIEMRLLTLLLTRPGRVLSYDEILHSVWGWDGESRGSVHAYIRSLRRKLGDSAADPRYIANEFGYGYRLLPDSVAPRQGDIVPQRL
jgi:DNA-binding response OmpR family regulator